MLIVNPDDNRRIERVTLLFEEHEALEVIEKLCYLLRVPSYHHDHLDDGESAVDLVIMSAENTGGFTEQLASIMREYFEQKSKRTM